MYISSPERSNRMSCLVFLISRGEMYRGYEASGRIDTKQSTFRHDSSNQLNQSTQPRARRLWGSM